jgi:hypothetical protein
MERSKMPANGVVTTTLKMWSTGRVPVPVPMHFGFAASY